MLFIVPTPIGNLQDISERVLNVLRNVDVILAEDTRRTKRLLQQFSITTPVQSFHEHNEKRKTVQVLRQLQLGKHIALVSDSGTPLLSDPGFYLVRECVKKHICVSPLPGPNAAITALTGSGFPTDAFVFYGFVPKKKKVCFFEQVLQEGKTVVLYESPYRIVKTLDVIKQLASARQLCIARELTKKHEEFLHGTADELLQVLQGKTNIKGEITLLISK